jgi:hypothetical protein
VEAISNITRSEGSENANFSIDTTFVMFFLALDLGQNLGHFGFDTILITMVLMMVAVFPIFIAPTGNKPFGNWLLGRGLIIVFALVLGLIFKQTLGIVFPESFNFLPLTFLILAAMISCYLQFYYFFKPRLSN